MNENEQWVDDDGFSWGWRFVGARAIEGELYVQVASVYHGCGYFTSKYWVPGRGVYVDVNLG